MPFVLHSLFTLNSFFCFVLGIFISLSAPGKSFKSLLGAQELHVSPSPLFMPCLSGSQSHFSVTFINLSTKNIWYVLRAWKPGKHLVSLVFHGRLSQRVKDSDSSASDPCGHGLVSCPRRDSHLLCRGRAGERWQHKQSQGLCGYPSALALIPDLFQVTQLYPGSSIWVINL